VQAKNLQHGVEMETWEGIKSKKIDEVSNKGEKRKVKDTKRSILC